MSRDDVYAALDSERAYQDRSALDPSRPDMVGLERFSLGDGLSAIEHNLHLARERWYRGSGPHQEALEYLRKVAAIVVQLGEKYGLPSRPWDVRVGQWYERRSDKQRYQVETVTATGVYFLDRVVPFDRFFLDYRLVEVPRPPDAKEVEGRRIWFTVAEVEHEIISAIEQAPTGSQDPVWDPVYAALEKLRKL